MDTKAITELAKEAGMTVFGKHNGLLESAGVDKTAFTRLRKSQSNKIHLETALKIAVVLADSLGQSRSQILGKVTGIEKMKRAV
jgi:hypothetical protein